MPGLDPSSICPQKKAAGITFALKMKNHLDQSLGFSVLLLFMLLGLSLVPESTSLGDFSLRKMDILSDVRANTAPHASGSENPIDTLVYGAEDSLELAGADTLTQDSIVIGPFPPKDSSLFGEIIEDYSFDQSGLSRLFGAVDSIKYGRNVRIAWYGDSFVEGDILIGDLRDTLQSLWGGGGVGFVPITSEVAQFKRSIKHQFKNWSTFSIVKKSEKKPALGLNGFAYQPKLDASITYEGEKYFKHTKAWTAIRLFFTAGNPSAFEWQVQDKAPRFDQLRPKKTGLNTWQWAGNYPGCTYLNMKFAADSNLTLYGASLESGPGVYIDNFSVRGNSGGPLKQLSPAFIQQFDAVQQYDLIVLQVGLNAVTNNLTNIRWYQAELERTFKHLRACFPNKQILIVSVGDRGGKIGTELATMVSVPYIVAMQRDLARRHGFLFYDLFKGMGGPGTMIRFSMHHPRLANTDYTHLTHEGGRVLGLLFARVLQAEQGRWTRHKSLLK